MRDENKEIEDLVKLFIKVKSEKSVTLRCPVVLFQNILPLANSFAKKIIGARWQPTGPEWRGIYFWVTLVRVLEYPQLKYI